MGNAIAKKFNLPTQHTATAGHVNNWKIWPGKSKDGGQLVSIWAFDKTDLTKRKLNPVADKAIVEQVFQIMKRDFGVIKESKACSNIIQIIEVVDDSKNSIAFTTERIVCSLADILNNFENVPGGIAEHASFFESGAAVSEMEISRGLLNITLAIQYLHTVQRKLHLNLTPENIVITATGQWKLCGFGFSLNFVQGEQQRLASPYFMQAYPPTTLALVTRLEPDLRYAAPECTDGGLNPPGVRYLTPVADIFSLGLVFYEIYRFNLKYSSAERSYNKPLVPVTNNDAQQHHIALSSLQGVDFGFMPQGVVSIVSSMMQMNLQLRATSADVVSNAYFVSGTQAVLNMIETMHTRDLGTQSSQLLSLQPELGNFPARMLIYSILPAISKLCITTPNLWVYALPLHAELSRLLPEDKYMYFAGPYIAQGLTAPDPPTETMQVFLASMEFLCRTFGAEFFQANVTVLFCNALEKPNLYLQNLALEKLAEQYVHTLFTATTLVEKLMPQLCKEACKNPEPSIKIQALYIISLVTWKLDESYVAANILASLKYITDHEKNPQVSMSVVGNFESISNSLGLNYIAVSILPILQTMLLDTGLDKNQFEMVVNMIKRLLKKILDKRTAELNIPPISVAEIPGSEVVDPFQNAKMLIQQSKERNQANNYGMVVGSYKNFSGDRHITSTNAAANSAYHITAPTRPAQTPAVPGNNAEVNVSLSSYQSIQPSYVNTAKPLSEQIAAMNAAAVQTAPSGAPAMPTKAPPPLPSAPPPSHAPPPVPPPTAVAGFGASQSAPLAPSSSYGGTGSSVAPSLGTYNSGGASSGGLAGLGGLNSCNNSSSTATSNMVSHPAISTYQSSFSTSAPLSSASTPATSGYGTPLSPLDSGLPGFGGPSMGIGGYGNGDATSKITGIGSGPLGDQPAEKRSSFSWFGSSKGKTPAAGTKESLMDSAAADLYVPPVVPAASYSSTAKPSSAMGGTSTGMSGAAYNAGISAGPNDLDDFLSSFGQSKPMSAAVPNAPASAYSNPAATGVAGASFSASPTPAFRSSFGASTGSYNPTPAPAPQPAASAGAPRSTMSNAAGAGGLTIEQQIAQAQQEIARLSASQQQQQQPQSASSAWPAPATQHFGYGSTVPASGTTAVGAGNMGGAYGGANTGNNSSGMGGIMNAGAYNGYPPQQQIPAQQPYYGGGQPMGQPMGGGYPAQGGYPQQGTIPGYSYNPNINNMGGNRMGMGGGAPSASGYQPPMVPAANTGAPAQQKGKTDVFDFLS